MTKLTQYSGLLAEIKARIGAAQARAILAVNSELVGLYWQIGQLLDARQAQEGWGAAVIPRLSRDLHNELPEHKGFSERNIKLMLQFYRAYPLLFEVALPIGQPVVAPTARAKPAPVSPPIVQPVVAQLPWAHNVLLLQAVKDETARHWYAEQTLQNGWSRNVLRVQIDTQAHTRQGRVTSNFAARLPMQQSDLVQQALKDPYVFDFLTLADSFHERELETGLIRHLEKFLLELGQGFAFVGRQFRVTIGDDDFYIDLLFYHLNLRCYVVVELKRGKFKPEYAGKLNFYCNVVDDRLRHQQDAPTIGLMLCQSKDSVLAEYALRGIDKPLGIATYELTRALPSTLASALPSIEAIEAELSGASE
jgi:predicted nuclease of restriction endonuclease-like (RecB) superfamily